MRVLLSTSDPAGQGVNYIRVANLARVMAGQGHAVCVLASPSAAVGEASRMAQQGVELLMGTRVEPRRLLRSGWAPIDLAARIRRLRGRRFDVVHVFGHRPSAWMPPWILRKQLGAAILADWADWFGAGGIAQRRGSLGRGTTGVTDEWLERRMPGWSGAITVITGFLEKMAVERGYAPERVLRITAGADVDSIRPMSKAEAKRRMGLEPAAPVVMNLGLSAWDKANLLEVCSRVAERHPAAILALAGPPSRSVRRASERGGWADRRLDLPWVAHESLGPILACADVIVLPFPAIGMNLGRFPNQAADAMAAGRPIVTNPTGDLGAFIGEAQAGLLAGEEPNAMADAVARILADRSLAEALGENGRRAAVERLAWPILADNVLSLYQRVI
jgi:glycosyltransferase involved in cell wall biosynthesis